MVTLLASCKTMIVPSPPEFDSNFRPSRRQFEAPSARIASAATPDAIEGSSAASAGVIRRAGRTADERTVITDPNGFRGSLNWPT